MILRKILNELLGQSNVSTVESGYRPLRESQRLPLGPLQAICSFQPQPLGTTDVFSVRVVLSFPEGYINGIMPYAIFRSWLVIYHNALVSRGSLV